MTGKQSDAFMEGEGQAWLRRNLTKLSPENDPVLEAIKTYRIVPANVLEIGCANGWRLDALAQQYDCESYGVDPSGHLKTKSSLIYRGTADRLPAHTDCFDLVIYGWCLYLCDPEDYFCIVSEGDRVLKENGYLIVYDFCSDKPYKVEYKHKKGLFSYHYDFSKLWLSHPFYSLVGRTVQNETCVIILKKNTKAAFPLEK